MPVGAIIGSAALTTGGSLYASNQANKTAQNIAKSSQVDPAQIGISSLNTQGMLAPRVLELEQQYRPAYTALGNSTLQQQLFGSSGFNSTRYLQSRPDLQANWDADPGYREIYGSIDNYAQQDWKTNGGSNPEFSTPASGGILDIYSTATPQMGTLQTDANRQQREADIADLETYGARATAAIRAANPDVGRSMQSLEERINSARNVTPRAATGSLGPAPVISAPTLGAASRMTAARAGTTQARGSRLMGSLESYAAGGLGQVTPLQLELQRQAMSDLGAGGQMTEQERYNISQGIRGAAASRGMDLSNSAFADEILGLDSAQRQRQAERRGFAQSVDAAGYAQLAGNRSFASGIADMGNTLSLSNANLRQQTNLTNAQFEQQAGITNVGAENQFALNRYSTEADIAKSNAGLEAQYGLTRYGAENDMARFNAEMERAALNDDVARMAQLASMYQSQAINPYDQVLGRSAAPALAAGVVGQAQGTQAGPTMFDPYNSGITSIYAGNNANQLAAQTAGANNSAAITSAGISSLGQLGGAYAGYLMNN